jgi:hypothetical protein
MRGRILHLANIVWKTDIGRCERTVYEDKWEWESPVDFFINIWQAAAAILKAPCFQNGHYPCGRNHDRSVAQTHLRV